MRYQHITTEDLNNSNRIYRAHLINSLSGYKSVNLIATLHENGSANLGVFSNIVHIGADPALIGFINRPREAAPHTLSNIERTGKYTINHIHKEIVLQSHQCSAKYPEDVSEFEVNGLTPEIIEGLPVPFVKESRVKYFVNLVEIVPIKHNNTFLVIGNITEIFLFPGIMEEDGFISLEKAGSLCSLGTDAYYSPEMITRLPYAKVR